MTMEPSSLFATTDTPAIPTAAEWVAEVLTGTAASALAVIAVAVVGMLMLTGRLALREAARVVLGCFVLFGAPAIASGLWSLASDTAQPAPPQVIEVSPPAARPPLPPSTYDPYAGASLRQD